ncbi:MAG: M12 family metallo-peptidase [Bacteroidota bacterium]|nr:M12 family metallo-peptidase [Bacteroidota bacterium]
MFRRNIIIFLLFYTTTAFSYELFVPYPGNDIIATKNPNNTLGLLLNQKIYKELLIQSPNNFILKLPFFGTALQLSLEKNTTLFSNLRAISKTEEGDKLLDFVPDLLSYEIFYKNKSIGVINFVNGEILATFRINSQQYEITKFKNSYLLFQVSNSINSSNFICGVNQESANIVLNNQPESVMTPKCIELALDIDYFTRQTFANDQEATDWALAIMSGVGQIFEAEFNVGVSIVHVQIWNTQDPYDTPALNGNAGAMLSEFGNYWNTNNGSINRDLVHLLSKRGNTGTGGIAWLNVLCSSGSGYAFSSVLNNDTTFSFPNPSYTWNLEVVAHEIGHNIASPHTHACNWAADPAFGFTGGGIDDCGPSAGYGNPCVPPAPTLSSPGTIMSYCHLGGSGIILEFHDIVISQALTPNINSAGCITTCDYYGCTDSTAFNYDPNATVDDGSCISVIYGCTDSTAANYDPNANTDDGTCTYCASLTFNITHLSCNNSNDGAIDMSVQLGNPPIPLSYTWSGPNGFSSNTEDINNLQPGNYTITATDGLGCIDVITLTINNPLPLSLDSTISNNVSCHSMFNGTINVYVSGGTLPYIYNWGGVNPTALAAGTYTVDVTDINNCPSVMDTITITEPPVLSSSTNITDISCYGQGDGSIDLTVIGGVINYSYQWHGPNSFFDTNEDISSLEPGTYTVLVTDANGCVNMLNIIIIEPPALVASSIVNDVSCNLGNDGAIDLSVLGGSPPYSYLWSNGAITEDQFNLIAGVYTVDIMDTNGCAIPTIAFTVNQPLPSSINTQVIPVDCHGDNTGFIDLTYIPAVGINQYSFNWTGPNNFSSILEDLSNLYSGAYTPDIIENNCTITNTYFVSEPAAITTVENIQNVSCFDSTDGSILLFITGGIPTYNTDWGNNNPQSLSAGIYTYTITDQNNCVFIDTVAVNQPDTFDINYSLTHVSCFNGNDGSVTLIISGGTSPYISTWQNTIPTQLSAGYHGYTIIDNNSCTYSDSVFINQPLPITVAENISNILCSGSNTGSAILNINGGTPPYFTNWHGFNNLTLSAGNYIYDIIDSNNCVYTSIISITEPNPIIVSPNISASTCPESLDGQVHITIIGGIPPYQQNWGLFNPQFISSGLYHFTVVDSNGCIDSNQVFVPSLSNIYTNILVNNVSCFGFCDGGVNLSIMNGTPPYSIDWFGLQPDSLCAGEYFYEITDNLGCIFLDTVTIQTPQPLSLSLTLNGVLLESNVVGGTIPYSYYWWDSNGNTTNTQAMVAMQTGSYYCVVVDINNCHSDTVIFQLNSTDILDITQNNINIFPNPFVDYVTIKLPMIHNNITLSLYDVLGQMVLYETYTFVDEMQLFRDNLVSGSYYLALEINNSRIWKKIIVK